MFKGMGGYVLFAVFCLLSTIFWGCAGSKESKGVKLVTFNTGYSSEVNLSNIQSLGVISVVNVKPRGQIDIDKIRNKISDEVASSLRQLEIKRIIEHDEIEWVFRGMQVDSSAVRNVKNLRRLHDELKMDGLVLVEIDHMDAELRQRWVPSRDRYGRVYPQATPGIAMHVVLKFDILNTQTGGSIWQKEFRRSRFQPIVFQLFGGGAESQVVSTIRPAVRAFISRLAPLRQGKIRGFVIPD